MNLDQQQKEAVFTKSRSALVIAGAGSGKTRVLTSRIEHLINDCKVSPFEIMSFSFTRAAAGEIKDRLVSSIGHDARKIHMGTMHSLALQFVRRFGEAIGLNSQTITVYNEWERETLLKETAKDMGIYNGKAWKVPKGTVDEMFADYYQAYNLPGDGHPGRKLFQAFNQRCRENNALTYGDLLICFQLLIPELEKRLKIRHILVDEVQDIDTLQWMIINTMADAFDADLFVVGDPDQSIFEWRGAVPGYLIQTQDIFDIYKLETNYRSDPSIIRAANSLINYNHDRIEKTMCPNGKPPGFEPVMTIRDCDTAAMVSMMGMIPTQNTAILARTHSLLKKLSNSLDDAGIDHQYVGQKTDLVNGESFRRFLAFLKLIVNGQDNFSFLLIRDLIGLSTVEYNQIRSHSAENGISHFESWLMYGKDPLGYARLFEFQVHFDEIIDAIYAALPFDCKNIVDFIKSHHRGNLRGFLDWIATYDISEETREDFEGLRLMTIHAAKGLEFKTVVIAGCNEGIIPSKQSLRHDGDLEAERRLMYVAVTRAEDRLILTIRPNVKQFEWGNVECPTSQFLREMEVKNDSPRTQNIG